MPRKMLKTRPTSDDVWKAISDLCIDAYIYENRNEVELTGAFNIEQVESRMISLCETAKKFETGLSKIDAGSIIRANELIGELTEHYRNVTKTNLNTSAQVPILEKIFKAVDGLEVDQFVKTSKEISTRHKISSDGGPSAAAKTLIARVFFDISSKKFEKISEAVTTDPGANHRETFKLLLARQYHAGTRASQVAIFQFPTVKRALQIGLPASWGGTKKLFIEAQVLSHSWDYDSATWKKKKSEIQKQVEKIWENVPSLPWHDEH